MPRIAQLSIPAWQPYGGARRRRQGWPSRQPWCWRRSRQTTPWRWRARRHAGARRMDLEAATAAIDVYGNDGASDGAASPEAHWSIRVESKRMLQGTMAWSTSPRSRSRKPRNQWDASIPSIEPDQAIKGSFGLIEGRGATEQGASRCAPDRSWRSQTHARQGRNWDRARAPTRIALALSALASNDARFQEARVSEHETAGFGPIR